MDRDRALKRIENKVLSLAPCRGYLAEGQLFQILSDSGAEFVRCLESAVCDGLILHGPPTAESNTVLNYSEAVQDEERTCTAFDVKSYNVYDRHGDGIKLVMNEVLKVWKNQRGHQAQVVDFLLLELLPGQEWALIPKWYIFKFHARINRRTVLGNKQLLLRLIRSSQGLPDYTAFVIHPKDFKEAFKKIRECAADPKKMFVNPSTGVTYSKWKIEPQPVAPVTRLLNSTRGLANTQIVRFAEAIALIPDCGLTLDTLRIAPLIADFVLHLEGQVFFVEAKRSYYHYRGQDILVHQTGHGRKSVIDEHVRWHYLFTESERRKEAYLVPRTQIEDWPSSTTQLAIDIPRTSWTQYRVDLASPGWIGKICQIIRETRHEVFKLRIGPVPSAATDFASLLNQARTEYEDLTTQAERDVGMGSLSEDFSETYILDRINQSCAEQ